MANNVTPFPLRITGKDVYKELKKEAKSKPGKWSVNTLINSILEEHQKKMKKELVISK